MSSWSNIVAKDNNVVVKKEKKILVKKEKNYDKEINKLKKQQYFNDKYESKIDDLYNKMKTTIESRLALPWLLNLSTSNPLQEFIYRNVDIDLEYDNYSNIDNFSDDSADDDINKNIN